MKRIGLTGGIASGKSTVAGILREMGFYVLDADSISHKLMEPGQAAYKEIVRVFGEGVLGTNDRIDRGRLAAVVFNDPSKLAELNAILHPRVEEAIFRQFAEWESSGTKNPVFVEAALLVEAGIADKLDGLVVAWCQPEQQLGRLRARGMSEDEARNRIAAQLPLETKLKRATETIDCSRSLAETRMQVERLAAKIRGTNS